MRSRAGNLVLVALLVLMLAGVAVAAVIALQAPAVDPETGCLEEGVVAETVALVDASDPIPDALLKTVLELLMGAALQGGPETRVRLFLLGGGQAVDLIELDAFCNRLSPGAGGPAYRTRIRRDFEARLQAGLAKAAAGQRDASPILEATERLLSRPGLTEVQDRDLIVISDLLQNTERFSFYPGKPGYVRPSALGSRLTTSRAACWRTVSIVELQRPGLRHLQTASVRRFWISCFKRMSAEVDLRRL